MTAAVSTVPQSGVAGVTWKTSARKWQVRVLHEGARVWLGRYDTVDEAVQGIEAWELTHEFNRDPESVNRDGYPTLGRTRMTDEQVAYALSIAHEIRGF